MPTADYMIEKADFPDLTVEQNLWRSGLKGAAGFDEAGRGALAGPVAVAAVILPPNDPKLSQTLAGTRDSKQMTPSQRDACAPIIKGIALSWSVAFACAEKIDALGIVQATRLAAVRALSALTNIPDSLLTDYRLDIPETELPQISLVHGDELCLSIAAASVLAKTARDAHMQELNERYPGYGLGQNKGYGTPAHRSAIKRLGYSPIHRKTFALKT